MFEQLPPKIYDLAANERELTAEAVSRRIHDGEAPELSDQAYADLRDLLADPQALDRAGEEKHSAANMIWRLGVVHHMSRLVLSSIEGMSSNDKEVLTEIGPMQRTGLARDLLKADPNLFKRMLPASRTVFWNLLGYHPDQVPDDNPHPIAEALPLLQHAAYLPDKIIQRLRHYRDTTTTMAHYPMLQDLPLHEARERHQELTESSLRTILGAFVAVKTGDETDCQLAERAMQDFAGRSLKDARGLTYALALSRNLEWNGMANHPRIQRLAQNLREHILVHLPQVSLIELSSDELVLLTQVSHDFAKHHPSPQLDDLLNNIGQTLQTYKSIGELPSLPLGSTVLSDDVEVHAVGDAKRRRTQINSALELLAGDKPERTAEMTLHELTDKGFTLDLVDEAFVWVTDELDPAKRAELWERFDQAIGAALQELKEDHKFLQPDGLDSVKFRIWLLARFPAGRQFIAQRTAAFVEYLRQEVDEPSSQLNHLSHPSMHILGLLSALHDSLWYSREYYHPTNPTAVQIVKDAVPVTEKILRLTEKGSITIELIREYAAGLALFFKEFTAAHDEAHSVSAARPHDKTIPPLEQLLAHYRQLSGRPKP